MGSFGDRLRRERELRGVTVAEIAESTKISKRSLEALESEEFDALPGGIFNRGFVRAYARYLGIDEEQAIADYVTASQEQPVPEDQFPLDVHQKEREGAPPLNPRRSSLPILLAILALVLVAGGWYWVKRKPLFGTGQPAATTSPGPVSPAPVVKPASTSTPQTAQPANPASQQTAVPSSTDADKTSSSPIKDGDKEKSPEKTPDQQPKESANIGKSFTVAIKATEESWVSVTADGKPVLDGVLAPDKLRLIKAGKQVVLKTGNARGIEVSYNGRPLGPLGSKENEVRTVIYNNKGPAQ